MNFWKWIGSDQRIEEALEQSQTVNLSPSNDDFDKAVIGPVNWEEVAFSGIANNNSTVRSKLSLWDDYTPGEQAAEPQFWGNVVKR